MAIVGRAITIDREIKERVNMKQTRSKAITLQGALEQSPILLFIDFISALLFRIMQ